jgi:FAD binding domain/Berberine and berberine like
MYTRSRLSRRALLAGAVAGVALPWGLRGARGETAASVSETAWKALEGKIAGGVVRPNDARFVDLTRPENLRYYNPPAGPDAPPDSDAPLGVVQPRDAREVAAAILWARQVGCPMVARSGGHSYAGCSTIRGLVVNLGAMRQVKYHPDSSLLELGGGVLNADIFAALRNTNRAIVHGRCPSVGISAFLMGGGIGLAMREHGVGCDLAESVELVLANGERVRASASNGYKDLFWAVRGGGGGNLAIATRWWLRTVPVDNVIAFTANWWSNDDKPGIFKKLVRALETAPDQMGAQMSVYATALNNPLPNRISLTGQFRGPLDKFKAILGSALAGAEQKMVLELPYWKAEQLFGIEATPNRYQETSLFADELSDELIEEAFSLSRTMPDAAAQGRLTFFLTGGQVNRIKPDATAFVHRSSQWLINPIVEQWPAHDDKVADALKWQRDILSRFTGMLGNAGSYQNFTDPGLDHPAEAYWGANLSRLAKIKAVVDPDSVFTPPRNQGIPRPA